MSLVERALKKLQESRAGLPEAAQPVARASAVFGKIVESTVPNPLDPTAVPRSTKTLVIDRSLLRAAGLLSPESQERQIADEYRQIKRPLIAKIFGLGGVPRLENGHLIMMASAVPGDGKTFSSINLALSIAMEKDISILLVDADVAKPHISTIFGVNKEPGLLDVLRDEKINVESVVLATNVPRLSILSAGTPSETATEFLASERMRQVVEQLGANDPNRIVLFDSPPLLLTSESRVLAGIVGQIVLVVCAGRTPQQAVFDTLDLLGEGKSIGLVLNQSDERSGSSYRYGYYGTVDAPQPNSNTSS
ncbi:MAG: AAA family ATPase [Candidatus Obscuribacterales bacterium]|nr:AAA family ATPase [Steroidobacteraceae bacterium]